MSMSGVLGNLINKVAAEKEGSMEQEEREYPKYESHCCGAPVKIVKYQKVKYYCEECSEPCIARKKK